MDHNNHDQTNIYHYIYHKGYNKPKKAVC